MLAVILLFVGHLSFLRVDAENTIITSVNRDMMESSFIIVFESTPARFAATVDISTHQIIPSSADLMSERARPATSNFFTGGGTSLLSMTFSVQKTRSTILLTTTMPESMTQTRVITTMLTSTGKLATTVDSLTVGMATVLPTFMTTNSPLPSVLIATAQEPQTSGGIVATIVVTVFTVVIVLVGVNVTILIICLKKRRRGRKYILGALKDGDTQGIFVNDGATTLEGGAENEATSSKLNHSLSITTSDFSGNHVYEMTEIARTKEQPQEPTNGSLPSTEQVGNISHRRQISSSWRGNHMRRQQRSFPHYENTQVLHRYNSVGDYEMMKPQLQKIINKRHTQALPVETVDIYSEIDHGVGNKDELYIEMKPEEMPNLSSEGDNLDSQAHEVSHKLVQQITEEDDRDEIYMEMEAEKDKITLSPNEQNFISQTSDNTPDQSIVEENAENVQNSTYIKMEPEGVTNVCTPLATEKDKHDDQTPNHQTLTQHTEQGSIYIDMEQDSVVHLPSSEHNGASNDVLDQPVLQVSEEDELNSIYIEMEQDTSNPPTPLKHHTSSNELEQPVTQEDNIYIEMEPDDAPDTLSPKHHSPHINSETADDQLLSQGSEDIYIVMH